MNWPWLPWWAQGRQTGRTDTTNQIRINPNTPPLSLTIAESEARIEADVARVRRYIVTGKWTR